MSGPSEQLIALATACLVRLSQETAGAGSGVWVAPGVLLTCAHVVPYGSRSRVTVDWEDQRLCGTVSAHVPNPDQAGLWPYPDLAIVEVTDAPPHPCAWLSERRPAHNSMLLALGYSAQLGEGLRRHCAGARFTGEHEFGFGTYWQVKGNEFVEGMSGGPVIDVATGAVCAVMTTTLGEGGDRGGYMVPVSGLAAVSVTGRRTLLAAHDRFHTADSRWTRLREHLPPPPLFTDLPLRPVEEVELLGHLAALADPPPAVLRSALVGDTPAGTLRDAAYQILDCCLAPGSAIDALFRLTCALTTAAPTDDLRGLYDWATAVAGRTGRRPQLDDIRSSASAPSAAAGGVISVEVAPGASRVDRYRLTVSVEDAHRTRRVLHKDREPTRDFADVQDLVTRQVRAALELLEGNALVEFVVPLELFDEPFDELRPVNPHTTLGRQHRVVLRDYDRQHDRVGRHAWRQRWRNLHAPAGEVRWLLCSEDIDPSDLWSDLDQSPSAGVLALTRRPSSNERSTELLRNALEAGMPAVVWRRDTCAEHDNGMVEDSCSGDAFRDAIDIVLRAQPIADLPERVRRLRSRAASTKADDVDRACRGTVLIWDDPGRAATGTWQEPPYRAAEA